MLGSTVPTVGGLPNGFIYADDWQCECIQIYVTLSRQWAVAKLTQGEVTAFKQAWRKSKVKQVVAHVPYLVNIASPDEEIRGKSRARLETEMYRAGEFGVPLLILHPGGFRNSTREEGIARIIEALDSLHQKFSKSSTRILLETMAGQGTMLGARFEELALILEKVKHPERLGICFDTAHVFAAGYDIRGYQGYEKVLAEFARVIGLGKIEAFHINDSKSELGSRVDRHEYIGKGSLGLQVFHALVRDARFQETPMLLEIPHMAVKDKQNLVLLRRLRKREKPIMK